VSEKSLFLTDSDSFSLFLLTVEPFLFIFI
jgi:hypothetical protein